MRGPSFCTELVCTDHLSWSTQAASAGGRLGSQVAVHGLAADAVLAGQVGLALASGDAFTEPAGLLGGQRRSPAVLGGPGAETR
jgi:hypothetical protein